jgi:dTDP-4-amino-4,6-dideoxygalactose transaminase
MPVVPFGLPFDYAAWDAFYAQTGVPVVIDAAAAFDTLRPGQVPSVVSLHSTKVLGIGEGGFVVTSNEALADDIERRTNFGFRWTRVAMEDAFNAKLSEYHAAVGLASLEEWPQARADWLRVTGTYRQALQFEETLTLQAGFGETWVSSVCVAQDLSGDASELERRLDAAGIETRKWWGDGPQSHPSMAGCAQTELPATQQLARSTLALPLHRDLPLEDVRRVCDVILDSN